MTSGEKRFARRIEALLEDDYLCWYDVSVGVKRRRPDFLILNPHRGLLTLEIKDWKLSSIIAADASLIKAEFNGRIVKEVNPLLKSQDFINVTIDLLKQDPLLVQSPDSRYAGKLCMPYGYGLVLSNITRRDFEASGLDSVMPGYLVICQDEMTESVDAESFQKRLWDMFLHPFPCQLTLPQIDRIRWRLFPDVRIVNPQGSLFDQAEDKATTIPDLIRVLDVQQEQLARSLGDGHRVIHGVAGSGKTMILGYRAEYLAQATAKPVLVLCFNRPLAQKLGGWMACKGLSEKVTVRTLHGWCRDMIRTYLLPMPAQGDGQYAEMVQTVIDGVNRKEVPAGQYSAVLIDEGHDFEPEWFRLILQMVDPDTNALLVLYDSAQDIYQKSRKRRFSFASVGIQAKGRTTILKLNYRNTAEVLNVAHAFAQELLTAEEAEDDSVPLISPQSAGRRGPRPVFIQLPTFRDEILCIADKLRASKEAGTPLRDMAVLAYRNAQIEQIVTLLTQNGIPAHAGLAANDDTNPERVNVLTLHASKVLEFSTVAIPGLGEMPYSSHDANEQARVLYVGMTRAMSELVMTAHKDSAFAVKLRGACEHVAT
jgi:hypothetical protein